MKRNVHSHFEPLSIVNFKKNACNILKRVYNRNIRRVNSFIGGLKTVLSPLYECCFPSKRVEKVYRRFTMNKEELVKEISKKTKLSQKVSSDVLSATLEIIQKTVAKGKKVTLVGFGTWEARKRAARIGRNPQTGKELKIAAKTVPAFSAGKSFKELVK